MLAVVAAFPDKRIAREWRIPPRDPTRIQAGCPQVLKALALELIKEYEERAVEVRHALIDGETHGRKGESLTMISCHLCSRPVSVFQR